MRVEKTLEYGESCAAPQTVLWPVPHGRFVQISEEILHMILPGLVMATSRSVLPYSAKLSKIFFLSRYVNTQSLIAKEICTSITLLIFMPGQFYGVH